VYTIMEHGGRKLLVADDGTAVRFGPSGPDRGFTPLASPEDLARGARSVPPAGVAAAKSAIDVQQFLSGVDGAGRQYGATVSGRLDMNPTVPPTGWNVVPQEESVAALCDDPLRSEEPEADKLVCDGGAR
jgi:hypothetical protein